MLKHILLLLSVLFFSFIPNTTPVYKNELRQNIKTILDKFGGDIGVSVMNLETGDTLSFREYSRHVMQDVYLFPLAITMLHQVDLKKFSLDQKIHVGQNEYIPGLLTSITRKYPHGVDLPLSELLRYAVCEEDENASVALFKLLGGPTVVQAYVNSLGVKGISIAVTEVDIRANWKEQYKNWAEPQALLRLLDLFYKGKTLSKSSTDLLMEMMTKVVLGLDRIKGGLPAGTVVAHKSGSSGSVGTTGQMLATNDIGIVTLPNGKHFAIVVLVADKSAPQEACESIIADVTRLVWDYSVLQ